MKTRFISIVAGVAALVLPLSSAKAGNVTLSILTTPTTASTGTYSVFASITNSLSSAGAPGGQVAGLSSVSFDILAGGGVQVATRTLQAPRGTYLSTDAVQPDSPFGFQNFRSSGTLAGGSVTGLTAGQPTVYSGGNDPASDYLVIVGIGLQPASNFRGTTLSYANPVLLASGTYTNTGAGTLTAQLSSGGQFNLLKDTDIASGFQWAGPGNVEAATLVSPGVATVVPEPSTMAFLGLSGLVLVRRKRSTRQG